METLNGPLNKAQIDILKLLSRIKTEDQLLELKKVIVDFYAKRLMDKADEIWEERGYTQEDMERLANLPS